MSDGITCDRCGKSLLVDEEVRYLVKVEVWAAYDPMEIAPEDLAKDRSEEIRSLTEQLGRMTEQEAMDSVYRKLVFDLCPSCQRDYLANPLGRGTHP
jgi:hypothetical protein